MKKKKLVAIFAFISIISYTDMGYKLSNGIDEIKNPSKNIKLKRSRRAASNPATNGIAQGTEVTATNDSAVFGIRSKAEGERTIVVGVDSSSKSKESVVIGYKSTTEKENSVAIGSNSNVTGKNSVAVGSDTKVEGSGASAFGYKANAKGESSVAFGVDTTASGLRSVAIGKGAMATKNDDIAVGSGAKTNTRNITMVDKQESKSSLAFGINATADGVNTISIGTGTKAEQSSAIAIGGEAAGVGAVTIGYVTSAKAHSTVAIGYYAKALKSSATAIGSQAEASGQVSTAIGATAKATETYAVSIGAKSEASFKGSVAIGSGSKTDSKATKETEATVNKITYSEFAGSNPDEGYVVSVGTEIPSTNKSTPGKIIKRQIKNVAAGKISKESTDAINGSQLYMTNNVLGNLADSTKTILGGNASITTSGNDAGKLTITNIGNTNKDNIHDAIIAAKTTMTVNDKEEENKSNGNLILTSETDAKDGHKKYNVKLNDKITLGKDDNKISLDGNTGNVTIGKIEVKGTAGTINNLTNKTWDLNKYVSGQAATEDQLKMLHDTLNTTITGFGFNVMAGKHGTGQATGEQLEKVSKDNTVKYIAGDNLKITQSGKDFTYELNKELKDLISSEYKDKNGNTTKITNNGMTINSGDKSVSITKDGLNNGGNKITNVADGTDDKDGVNLSQLNKVKQDIENKISNQVKTEITANDGQEANKTTGNVVLTEKTENGKKIYDVKLNDKISLGSGDKKVELDGTKGEIKAGDVTINKENKGTINGLTNKTWDANNFTSGQAATEDQLKSLSDNIDSKISNFGFNVEAGKEGTGTVSGKSEKTKVSKDDTVKFNAGNNLDIKQNGKDFTYSLNKELKDLTSSEFKDKDENTTTITGDGMKINSKDGKSITLTKDGLNNGGNKITNIADGTENNDAVNVKQLKDSRTEIKSENGSAISVKSSYDSSKNKYTYTLDVKTDNKTIIKDKDGTLKANVGNITTEENNGKYIAKTSNTEQIAKTGDVVNAINGLGNNTFSFSGDTGSTEEQSLNKSGGLKFAIKGSEYIKTVAKGSEVSVDLTDKAKEDIEKGVIANSGVANAVAMASLPQISSLGGHRHNIAGSYGYFNGEHAFALGISGLNDVGNLVYRAGGSLNTKGHVSLGAGLGYQFDKLASRKRDMFVLQRNGNINLLDEKVYELEMEVENLKKENKELKKELLELKEMFKELMKK
ncbi:YadA-like family protein [Streptobacillus moniliformis]|uniref:YadA-like family protein n=1 Tax=Streptobacillus moniliformis TaxID=34105 RepID=UPI0007E3F27F|nr:YadA-like family protein [Streptobacillus moniliformis]